MSAPRATRGNLVRAGSLVPGVLDRVATRYLFATIGERRLRVCGFHHDGTPILVDGTTAIGLDAAAREAGVEPGDVVIEEAEA